MSAPVVAGDIVLDKYRVERVLGQGGMGIVVAATHVDLDQRVALKFLLPGALEHAETVERFAREAKAAARIQSQHVARVLDTGRMPSGAPFMVMEYLEGEDLGCILKRSGPMAIGVVADYLLQACEAIGEAHSAGIVHRDLKPSNLFLARQRDRRSIIKVLDFGISKLTEKGAAPLTGSTAAMGSPHYMSPEQLLSSRDVDARSDIWALGVVLYELASGKRPFEGDTMPEVVGQILHNDPARLSSLRDGISLELELVVARCLATEVKNRFPSVADLARSLRVFATDAASASASVARTTRILGGPSIPPSREVPGPASGGVITVPAPEVRMPELGGVPPPEALALDATVGPPRREPSALESAPGPQPRAIPDSSERESVREFGLASTTPAVETHVRRHLEATVEPTPQRRSRVIAGGAVLAVLVLAGVRAGMSSSTAASSGDGRPSAASPSSATATATATPTTTELSSAASFVATSSAPPPSASGTSSASSSVVSSASPRATRPPSGPTPPSSSRLPKDPFSMDLK